VAAELGGVDVDGINISEAMLAVAREKRLYRDHIVVDLTGPLDLPDERYGGFVSSGTFTHGHVGPVCLEELLRLARPGALFCLGTIPVVFDQVGFGSSFALLVAAGRITPLTFETIPIYEGADHPHAGDRGLVALFRKAG
jgi:SAM-dependent methyltransferase